MQASFSGAGFTSCSNPATAQVLPWHAEIRRTTGANGTPFVSGFTVKLNTVLFGECIYGGNPTFALTGGSGAELSISNGTLERKGGETVCPAKALLSASYVLSSPSPLYVTSP